MTGPADILRTAARRHPDRTALVTATRTLTYRELDAAAAAVAGGLRDRGIAPGDVVTLYAPNRWEWLAAYHGALRAGAVVNPANALLTAEELGYVTQDCRAAAVITTSALRERVTGVALVVDLDNGADAVPFADLLEAAPREPVDVDGPCTIAYTSGTTGHPKGAVQSHYGVLVNCALTATMHARREDDVVVTALPLPHVYGNVAVHSTFCVGGTVVLRERFSPGDVFAAIEEHRATIFEGVPAMYAMLLADPALARADLSSLTRSTVGGQTIAVTTMRAWQERSGAPLLQVWGMTELSGHATTHSPHAPEVLGSIGVAYPGVQIRVADLDDPARDAPDGVRGELLVRGPVVMLGYHDRPEATAETIDADGWLRTGDLGYRDPTGHLFVVDRKKDLIITGGYNVYPAEIERVLAGHPAVAMVAAGPVPDAVKGELACAYVVLRPGETATADELIAFTTPHLAPYKRPRLVRFVDRLPATPSGKIKRRELAGL
ncbi:class I adenylate-forming enzyme family protein [Amycolatopsis sp. NBC_01286]|uniref:class I adenylate-forming enzyme family protein n=1 Tax=Amycolatopsis sp. NBC_01286 TaxID=2903560 RepID=UPI002E0F03DA|nr:AMP-binding protein [Amycolatopsis sp. NBC_01286]